MSLVRYLPPLAEILLLAATGRAVLSLLPAGRLGSHAPRDLPLTWAASHLLGLAAIVWTSAALLPLHAAPPMWAIAAGWIALGLLRALAGPGAFVPGSPAPPPRARGKWAWSRVAAWIAGAALLGPAVLLVAKGGGASAFARAPGPLALSLCLPALGLFVRAGFAAARRPAAASWLLVALLATVPELFGAAAHRPSILAAPLFSAAGCALLVSAWRTADRRAEVMALISFAVLAGWSPDQRWLGILGLAAPLLRSGASARRRLALLATACALLVAVPIGWPSGLGPRPAAPLAALSTAERLRFALLDGLLPALGDLSAWGATWPLAALGLLALSFAQIAGRRGDPWPDPAEEARPLAVLLGAALAAQVAAEVLGPASVPPPWENLLTSLAPLAVLAGGLALLPGERASPRA